MDATPAIDELEGTQHERSVTKSKWSLLKVRSPVLTLPRPFQLIPDIHKGCSAKPRAALLADKADFWFCERFA